MPVGGENERRQRVLYIIVSMDKHRVTQEYTRVDSGGASNIKVTIRARPPELQGASTDFIEITQPGEEDGGARILIKNPDGNSSKKHAEVAYTFDNIFDQDVSQEKVFRDTCRFQIDHVMEGYNCCCFACKYRYTLTFLQLFITYTPITFSHFIQSTQLIIF